MRRITMLEPMSNKPGQLHSLTGLRFFAALMVFGLHVAGRGNMDKSEGAFNLLGAGMVGVSFFFILSGFVLAWTARPGDGARQFYQRRFARIYPLYALCWLIALGLLVVIRDHPLSWQDFAPLSLLQAWVPSDTIYFAVSAVFWSLSCEAFFYLMFPLIFRLLRNLGTPGRLIGMAIVVAVVVTVAFVVHPVQEGSASYWFIYFFPPIRIFEFILGILLALQMKRSSSFPVPLWAAASLVVVVYFADSFLPGAFKPVAVTLIPFALVIWAAARADLLGLWSPFRNRILVTLGIWSYSFYLIHSQALTVWITVLGQFGIKISTSSGPTLVAILLGALVVGIVAAAILHKLVEKPAEKWLRPKTRTTDAETALAP
jgi:peptidoglycan/LPS O-acetylase OafA/YrhL